MVRSWEQTIDQPTSVYISRYITFPTTLIREGKQLHLHIKWESRYCDEGGDVGDWVSLTGKVLLF